MWRQRRKLVPLDKSWLPLSWNTDHHRQKNCNRSAKRWIWRYRFSDGVWNCQILNHVVESQLFTSLWNRYHQWLSGIELIQISAFFSFLSEDQPLFHCWKANRGLKLSRNSGAPENDHLHIYSLWFAVHDQDLFLHFFPCKQVQGSRVSSDITACVVTRGDARKEYKFRASCACNRACHSFLTPVRVQVIFFLLHCCCLLPYSNSFPIYIHVQYFWEANVNMRSRYTRRFICLKLWLQVLLMVSASIH